jgi:hypothetical protein
VFLGAPQSIGELRAMIANIADDVVLGSTTQTAPKLYSALDGSAPMVYFDFD